MFALLKSKQCSTVKPFSINVISFHQNGYLRITSYCRKFKPELFSTFTLVFVSQIVVCYIMLSSLKCDSNDFVQHWYPVWYH